ncbi:pre-mRNA-splicing factor CWC22 homolog [Centruroides vittatus]|uniref:pre-mRNA-splicing factor CWC22 homolog n=1 Tax=Centruroides vittatus TaxID=120091 RepID=UPI00350EF235
MSVKVCEKDLTRTADDQRARGSTSAFVEVAEVYVQKDNNSKMSRIELRRVSKIYKKESVTEILEENKSKIKKSVTTETYSVISNEFSVSSAENSHESVSSTSASIVNTNIERRHLFKKFMIVKKFSSIREVNYKEDETSLLDDYSSETRDSELGATSRYCTKTIDEIMNENADEIVEKQIEKDMNKLKSFSMPEEVAYNNERFLPKKEFSRKSDKENSAENSNHQVDEEIEKNMKKLRSFFMPEEVAYNYRRSLPKKEFTPKSEKQVRKYFPV